jgi:photosystem II stability/assembly factor-like uncharacterized protein
MIKLINTVTEVNISGNDIDIFTYYSQDEDLLKFFITIERTTVNNVYFEQGYLGYNQIGFPDINFFINSSGELIVSDPELANNFYINEEGYLIYDENIVLGWEVAYQVPGNNSRLFSIFALNNDFNKVWVCGESDKVYYSVSGGINWSASNSIVYIGYGNIIYPLAYGLDLFFINDDLGFITANYPHSIYKTIDGGVNWSRVANGISFGHANLRGVWFLNENIGFCTSVTGKIYKTVNSGSLWYTVRNNDNKSLNKVKFYDSLIGYACGNTLICKTINAGDNWIDINVSYNVLNLHILTDELIYFTTGNNKILKTVDGCDSFEEINIPCPYAKSLYFKDELIGWIGGSDGNIYKTVDGGSNWINEFSTGKGESYNDISGIVLNEDSSKGYFCQESRPGLIYKI